jgi:hypothetical protein
MEALPKWAGHAAFNMNNSGIRARDAPGLDADGFEHVTALMRAYYDTLLVQPVPDSLLSLMDKFRTASKRAGREGDGRMALPSR